MSFNLFNKIVMIFFLRFVIPSVFSVLLALIALLLHQFCRLHSEASISSSVVLDSNEKISNERLYLELKGTIVFCSFYNCRPWNFIVMFTISSTFIQYKYSYLYQFCFIKFWSSLSVGSSFVRMIFFAAPFLKEWLYKLHN